MPKIYGSANGFWTTACITIPDKVKPMPTQADNNTLGKRKVQIISSKYLLPLLASKIPSPTNNCVYTSCNDKFTEPNFIPQNIEKSKHIKRQIKRLFRFIFLKFINLILFT